MHKRPTTRNIDEKRIEATKRPAASVGRHLEGILWLSNLRAIQRPGDTSVRYTRLTSETLASVRLATYTHSEISNFNWRIVSTDVNTVRDCRAARVQIRRCANLVTG